MANDPYNDPQLPGLVRSALEMRDEGLEPCFEVICHERPDLRQAVEESVRISRQLPSLRQAAASQDRLRGRVLADRYRLRLRLGAGAMGVVYLAEDQELRRSVAVKILRSELLDEDESEHRFSREAEALAAVQHRAVVAIHDRGRTAEDDPFMVMELLEGQPLNRLLEEGKRVTNTGGQDTGWLARELGVQNLDEPSTIRTMVSWAADLASGLAMAHQSGIYHRDVKPSNVFIRKEGGPVLLDFGIAALANKATITRQDATVGTPAYMAPEALEPDTRPSEALDVYGLSATLYHMLTLRSPYVGSPTQILTQLAIRDPLLARKACPGLPRDLQAILDCGMSRRPGSRYGSASELEADLRAFLDYRPVQARHLSAATRLFRRLARSQAFLAGAAVALVAVLALFGYLGRNAWLEGRREAHHELWRRVPPNLTLVAPSSRVLTPQGGRTEIEDLLNDAAEVCVDVLPTLLVRAAFRLDHGNPQGAAADMRSIADDLDSAYAREVARRYEAAAPGDRSVDLSDVGEPRERLDLYLAAFHAMRDRDNARAQELLADPRLSDYLPARELGLVYLARNPQRMFEEGVLVEEALGGRTAFTAYALGLAQLLQKHYERALELLREGVDLAPRSARMRVNAAKAAARLGDLEEAREHLRVAIEVDPLYWRPYENLTRLWIDAGEVDLAREVLDTAPEVVDADYAAPRAQLLGEILTEQAIQLYVSGRREEATAVAKEAMASFDAAAAHPKFRSTARNAMARALADDEPEAVASALAELIEDDPLHWRRMNILLGWIPEDTEQEDVQVLKRVLRAVSDELAERGQSDSAEMRRR